MQMTGKYYAIRALLLPGRSEVSLSAIPLERNGIVRTGYCLHWLLYNHGRAQD